MPRHEPFLPQSPGDKSLGCEQRPVNGARLTKKFPAGDVASKSLRINRQATTKLSEESGYDTFFPPFSPDPLLYPSYNLFRSILVIILRIKRRLLCVEDMVITGIGDGVGIDPGGGASTAGHAAVCSLRCR